MHEYQIFTDATFDLDEDLLKDIPKIEVIPMQVEIGGCEYTYGPTGNIAAETFYYLQRKGNFATTTQISPLVYEEKFTPYLEQGKDIIYLCFSSGLSGTLGSAQYCIAQLQMDYPDRKIICIDTLCASAGEGFLVYEAAQKQKEGYSIEELQQWIMSNRLNVCHWFTVDTFTHLRHGGRVSSAKAMIGTALNIKPLLHVDEKGSLQVAEKPRGQSNAIQAQIEKIKNGWTPERGNLILLAHGDNYDGVMKLKNEVSTHFPKAEIRITTIGPIVGSHTGPGMLAVLYWGNNR